MLAGRLVLRGDDAELLIQPSSLGKRVDTIKDGHCGHRFDSDKSTSLGGSNKLIYKFNKLYRV